MNIKNFTGFLLILPLLVILIGCGKKGPPSLPQKSIAQDGTGISGFRPLNVYCIKLYNPNIET